MTDWIEVENKAAIGRVTCGWKRPELSLQDVRPYWRDAHSPTIARRAGVYEYRHYPLDPVREDLFAPVPGIEYRAPANQQLMWLSDVRYADQAGLDAFGASPDPVVKSRILADIEMIVDKSTTYLVLGDRARTLIDRTGDPAPQGPARFPTFGIFLRSATDQTAFRTAVITLARRWARASGVLRVRLNLFEVPDMEAERKAGYPVKTHPLELQYQAWIDLTLEREIAARDLLGAADGLSGIVSTVHAYPAPAIYTFNHAGRPTLSGLRGYPAVAAIRSLDATHQGDVGLLEWLYGPVATGGPVIPMGTNGT